MGRRGEGPLGAVVRGILRRGARLPPPRSLALPALSPTPCPSQAECARLLLEARAAVDQRSAAGFTPLWMASLGGHVACIELLAGNGANVEDVLAARGTPLLAASLNDHPDAVAALLAAGADPRATFGGRRALDWARLNHFDACVALLDQRPDSRIGDPQPGILCDPVSPGSPPPPPPDSPTAGTPTAANIPNVPPPPPASSLLARYGSPPPPPSASPPPSTHVIASYRSARADDPSLAAHDPDDDDADFLASRRVVHRI